VVDRTRGERRRRGIAAAGLAAVVLGASAWLVLARDGGGSAKADETSGERSTATVERRDLVERETFDGALGFADERSLASGRAGTITWLADEGSTVRRGDELVEVDERPTVLMLGAVPEYRALSSGVEGADVRQLQRNLLALGFDDDGDLEVTGEFDADTASAVRDWQEDIGLERTGVVELGDVVFLPTARRMGARALEVGQIVAAGTQIAATTTPERIVTLDLGASDQELLAKGDRVRIELPSGERVDGRVSSVGRVAEADAEDPTAEPTVEVSIRLLGDVESELDQAPVDVDVETSRAEGVLAVPVQALLALAEGGYGLEVVQGTSTHLIGVQTGDFADGYVEVSGDGVAEGLEVVTAS
jgi:peptidoglycan hydrolase-like protein with peptidoglycan-binding domain